MATFRINYIQVMTQAKRIASLADDLKTQYNKLNTISQDTATTWKGEAATMTLQEIEEMKASILSDCKKMDAIADTIMSVARMIQQEDERRAAEARALADGN